MVAAAFQRQPFVMIPLIGAGFRDALLKMGRCSQIRSRPREDEGEVSMSTRADFRLRAAQNPDAEKRDLSVQIDSEAASLPICSDEAPRQPCYPCATSGGADGGASGRWGSLT